MAVGVSCMVRALAVSVRERAAPARDLGGALGGALARH
jgi:hypothetical protein